MAKKCTKKHDACAKLLFCFISLLLFELFLCQWFERMYLCAFVALYVRMFVAGANKVEGTMR